jgi:hypothetical protein
MREEGGKGDKGAKGRKGGKLKKVEKKTPTLSIVYYSLFIP